MNKQTKKKKVNSSNTSTTYDEGSGLPAARFRAENGAAFEVNATADSAVD